MADSNPSSSSSSSSVSSGESHRSNRNRDRANFSRERLILDQAREQELQERRLEAHREREQQERDRQRQGDRRQEGGRNDDSDEPTGDTPPQRKFAVPKRCMRVVRGWMTSTLSPSEAKQLRERFLPSFTDTDFDLKCPQVDSSLTWRFKDLKCPEMSKEEATEKSLKAEQYKVLDVARPLLYLKEQMAEGELQNSPMAEAVDVALRLWGHTFYGITASRRENLLKVSDPKFVSLLKEQERFKTKQCGALFGSHFIKEMVKEATNDQKLRSIGRPTGQPSSFKSRYPGPSYNPRSASGYHRSGYNGGNRGGIFSGSRISTEGFRNNKQKSSQRYVPVLSEPKQAACSSPIGGRLRFFVHFWHSISNDPWIIQSISEGVKIDFVSPPFQSHYQGNMLMGKNQLEICEQEIKSLLEKRAIEPIEPGKGFVSGLFVIPKRTGGFRLIVNIKALNSFVKPVHFKMEGIPLLQELIRPGDFFTKIDLQDAYLTLPLHKEDRKFVQIKWKKGVRLIIYLDDMLLLNSCKEGARKDFLLAREVLENCGFFISVKKSVDKPTQIIEYLGLIVNSLLFSLSLRQEKIVEILKLCGKLFKRKTASLREIARVLGNLAWAVKCIPFAQAHYRALQGFHITECSRANGFLNTTVTLDKESRDDLTWWVDNIESLNGRAMTAVEPDIIIYSDASKTGWGESKME
ncbi:hypothetical protein GHT06_002504 [Daphnia sinensis]|uniref:Reverse transcriptase domain-containing protein n=1 Tax=Daphnia sinensis TaxID=1820382 RepID=A0AAD5KGF1_9CRUS|nr:hypothetical protein GHT06_002504 [Daphnia sinensis]